MWIRFLEKLIMQTNGFRKKRRRVRHIGSPCKPTDYLKTVEFYTFKISQYKQVNHADSKKYANKCTINKNCAINAQVTKVLHSKIENAMALLIFARHRDWKWATKVKLRFPRSELFGDLNAPSCSRVSVIWPAMIQWRGSPIWFTDMEEVRFICLTSI